MIIVRKNPSNLEVAGGNRMDFKVPKVVISENCQDLNSMAVPTKIFTFV
jgi:hypothetical protein